LHAEGHFRPLLFWVRCWQAATYLGKKLWYQTQSGTLQNFSSGAMEILKGSWKKLPWAKSSGKR
jgi:hypothetical protein